MNFLGVSRKRGESAPRAARCDFGVFNTVLGLSWPLTYPAVYVASLKIKIGFGKGSPHPPFEFVNALEKAAADENENPGVRLYSALFLLMTLAPLRFCDTKDIKKCGKQNRLFAGFRLTTKIAAAR